MLTPSKGIISILVSVQCHSKKTSKSFTAQDQKAKTKLYLGNSSLTGHVQSIKFIIIIVSITIIIIITSLPYNKFSFYGIVPLDCI